MPSTQFSYHCSFWLIHSVPVPDPSTVKPHCSPAQYLTLNSLIGYWLSVVLCEQRSSPSALATLMMKLPPLDVRGLAVVEAHVNLGGQGRR